MSTKPVSFRRAVLHAAVLLIFAGCSPKFDWREVQGAGAPYAILLPAKPSSLSRQINIDGTEVTMTMTAAETGDVTFAAGTAELPDAVKAQQALGAMKTALIKNISGTLKQEKITGPAAAPTEIEIEATGAPGAHTGGQPRVMFARFIARAKRVYQLVVVGTEKTVTRELVDTFFTSFRIT